MRKACWLFLPGNPELSARFRTRPSWTRKLTSRLSAMSMNAKIVSAGKEMLDWRTNSKAMKTVTIFLLVKREEFRPNLSSKSSKTSKEKNKENYKNTMISRKRKSRLLKSNKLLRWLKSKKSKIKGSRKNSKREDKVIKTSCKNRKLKLLKTSRTIIRGVTILF